MEIYNLNDKQLSTTDHGDDQFAMDVFTGLSKSPKKISPKYFYDDVGSDLFQKITMHDDYYLTRTEFSILGKSSSRTTKIHQRADSRYYRIRSWRWA